MSDQHGDFRDRLKAAQHFTPEHREKFERSLKAMVQKTLTPGQRAGLLFAAVVTMAGVAMIAWFILADPARSPQVKYAFGLLGLVALVIALVRAKAAITGKMDLRRHPQLIAYVGWLGVIFFMIAIMISLPTPIGKLSICLMASAFFVLIVMAAELLQMRIGESELAVSEKLLEMELRLAEINEKLDRQAK